MHTLAWKTMAGLAALSLLLAGGCERGQKDGEAKDKASAQTDKSAQSDESGQEHHGMNHGEHGGGKAPEGIAEDQSWSGLTEHGDFFVEITPEPNPIPFQELFELHIRVRASKDSEAPLDGARLDEVRATMPAHDHGMKTAPEVLEEGPGSFRVRGMKFHMQGPGEDGRWVIQTTVHHEGTIDTAKFDVQCCKAK